MANEKKQKEQATVVMDVIRKPKPFLEYFKQLDCKPDDLLHITITKINDSPTEYLRDMMRTKERVAPEENTPVADQTCKEVWNVCISSKACPGRYQSEHDRFDMGCDLLYDDACNKENCPIKVADQTTAQEPLKDAWNEHAHYWLKYQLIHWQNNLKKIDERLPVLLKELTDGKKTTTENLILQLRTRGYDIPTVQELASLRQQLAQTTAQRDYRQEWVDIYYLGTRIFPTTSFVNRLLDEIDTLRQQLAQRPAKPDKELTVAPHVCSDCHKPIEGKDMFRGYHAIYCHDCWVKRGSPGKEFIVPKEPKDRDFHQEYDADKTPPAYTEMPNSGYVISRAWVEDIILALDQTREERDRLDQYLND